MAEFSTSIAFEELSNGRWTREEHLNFIKGLELHGKRWKKIADLIGTRTVVQTRTHAQKYFLKLQKGRPETSTSVQSEKDSSDVLKKKSKHMEVEVLTNELDRPQVVCQAKEEEDSLYPVDFFVDSCEFYVKGHEVLLRGAEGPS